MEKEKLCYQAPEAEVVELDTDIVLASEGWGSLIPFSLGDNDHPRW